MTTESTTAYIARNKNRLKSYGEKVYLKDGDNFEIELFNSYTTEVLAKIWLNDELISNSGLILKPGQRYFLERFLDTNNKFKFDTYEVEDSDAVKEAIKNNGKVRVEFYQKSLTGNYSIHNPALWTTINNPGGPNWTTTPNWWQTKDYTGEPYYGNITVTNSAGFTSDPGVFYSKSLNTEVACSMETGRIGRGEESEQHFDTVQMVFSPLASVIVELQILPTSQQPVEVNQIRNYCSDCGTRIRKQSWKFCPNCGEQLD